MPFEVLASPLQTTPEKLELLVKAGLWRIRMGVETGSERTKKEIYNRPMTNAVVKKAAAAITNTQMAVPVYFLIISNPYEEKEDVVDTIRFLLDLPNPFFLQSFDLVFYPGSALYELAVRDGIIHGKSDSGYQLDYRDGLHYRQQEWKRKNLYLNGLINLMEGKATSFKLGLLPRHIIPYLLNESVIEFNLKYPAFIKIMLAFKKFVFSFRAYIAKTLKTMMGNPMIIYDMKAGLRRERATKV
jgi:radical SAM superfamily enzyme YgiQ (UPF0313 family)